MLAPVRLYPTVMSFQSPQTSSPPKRPRLSLQIKTHATAQTLGKSATALKSDIDPTSPTAFNTLSNAYATAIENASPRTPKPSSGTETRSSKPTSLRLETTKFVRNDEYIHPSQRTQTPGPFSVAYPDTPISAFPSLSSSTPTTAHPQTKPALAAAFTFTPPQSAGSTEQPQSKTFTFAANTKISSPTTPRTPRRRVTIGSQAAPYSHPRALHSILRNSPLPPRSSVTPATPSRSSMRIANRAAKKVGYNDPLTQTITTNKYVKSHIDLLSDDTPDSATDPEGEKIETLDLTMAYTGDETRDGGQTPGPFEEMRRRMADSGLETPATRKRKRKDKKRKWEWTLGTDVTNTEDGDNRTPLTALKIQDTPITAIRRGMSVSTDGSEEESRYVPSISEDSEMEEASENDSVTSVRSEPIPSISQPL